MSLRRTLQGKLDIRPGEGRLVGWLFAHSLFLGVPRILTATAAMALFLAHFSAAQLPYVYMAAAVALPLSGFVRLRLAARLSLRGLFAADLVLAVMVTLLLWGGLQGPWFIWAVMALPVWAEVEWVVLNLEFWGLAGQLMNVRQGKRLFGLIGTGELIAGGLAGLAVPTLVAHLGTANLLALSAGAVVCCGGLLGHITRSFELGPLPGTARVERAPRKIRFLDLLRDRYLFLLFALVAVSYLGYYVIDNAFYGLTQTRLSDADQLASFLGVFWAFASLVTLAARAALSARVLIRYGLVGGLLALPLAIAGGVVLVSFTGLVAAGGAAVFSLMAVTKLLDQALRESVDKNAILVLYQPLSNRQRVGAQTAAEGIVGPLAGGLAGLALVFLLRVLHLGPVHLAMLMVGVVAFWAVLAMRLRTRYAEVLQGALSSGRFSGVALALQDASSLQVLEKGLESSHPGEVTFCLNSLEELGHPSLAPALERLASHAAPEVRREALLRLEKHAPPEALGTVRLRVIEETDAQARGAAIRALVALGEPEDLDKAIACVDDPEPEVRMGAVVGLLRHGGIEGVLVAGESLVEGARAADPDRRCSAAKAIGEVGIPSFYRPLLTLLRDDHPQVRKAALAAAAELRSPRTWSVVAESLEDPRFRSAAMSTLVAGGEAVLDLLERRYGEAAERGDGAAQRRIVRLCGQIRAPRSAAFLWSHAQCRDRDVRHAILSSLLQLGFWAVGEQKERVRQQILEELSEATGTLAALEDLDPEPSSLVNRALQNGLRASRERIFCLLSFVYAPEVILRVRMNLDHSSADRRAQAVELADSLLPKALSEALIPLFDQIPGQVRLERLARRFPQPRFAHQERLHRMIRGEDGVSGWTRACAIHVAAASGIEGHGAEFSEAARSPEAIVRETAAWAMARLASRPETGASREVELLVERFVKEMEGRGPGVLPMLSTVEKVLILRSVSVFSATPDDILAELAPRLEQAEVAAGEAVFKKGDMGSATFILVDGLVRVHDEDRTLRTLGPRDIFGEMAALDPQPRSASVTALEPTLLFRLEQEAVYELMEDRIEVVRGVIRVLCHRLRSIA